MVLLYSQGIQPDPTPPLFCCTCFNPSFPLPKALPINILFICSFLLRPSAVSASLPALESPPLDLVTLLLACHWVCVFPVQANWDVVSIGHLSCFSIYFILERTTIFLPLELPALMALTPFSLLSQVVSAAPRSASASFTLGKAAHSHLLETPSSPL